MGGVARSEALGPRLFEEVRLERIEPEIEQSSTCRKSFCGLGNFSVCSGLHSRTTGAALSLSLSLSLTHTHTHIHTHMHAHYAFLYAQIFTAAVWLDEKRNRHKM